MPRLEISSHVFVLHRSWAQNASFPNELIAHRRRQMAERVKNGLGVAPPLFLGGGESHLFQERRLARSFRELTQLATWLFFCFSRLFGIEPDPAMLCNDISMIPPICLSVALKTGPPSSNVLNRATPWLCYLQYDTQLFLIALITNAHRLFNVLF